MTLMVMAYSLWKPQIQIQKIIILHEINKKSILNTEMSALSNVLSCICILNILVSPFNLN